jgi:hypothetical protein
VSALEDTAGADAVLLERSFGSRGSADTLVVPEAAIVVDADLSSNSVNGLIWNTPFPAPQWSVVGQGPFVANPVSAGGDVVVADTHGTVTAVDAVTGFARWQRALGRLPMRLATDVGGRYVAVLDRSGEAVLLDARTGDELATAPAGAPPVGVAVVVDNDGATLVVADETSVRGYRPDGESSREAFDVDVAATAGPVSHGMDVLVTSAAGELVAIDSAGHVSRRYVSDFGLNRLVVGSDTAVGLDGKHAYFMSADDLTLTHRVRERGRAVSVGSFGVEPVFTFTGVDGDVTVRGADGRLRGTVQVSLTPETPAGYEDLGVGEAAQRAAAVSIDGTTWVSAVTGPIRFGSGS